MKEMSRGQLEGGDDIKDSREQETIAVSMECGLWSTALDSGMEAKGWILEMSTEDITGFGLTNISEAAVSLVAANP